MNHHRFHIAELSLGFQLPVEFWHPYEAGHQRVATLVAEHGEPLVCDGPQQLLDLQAGATEAALCVHEQMPEWWAAVFAIGETGDGGYFLMKRSGSAKVYIMDSDWYEPPRVAAADFNAFLTALENEDLP